MVIRLIHDSDESTYWREVEQLVFWCSHNLKTVEMPVDFRRHPSALFPFTISNNPVSTVETFRFLGTTISQDLKWETNINSVLKKALQRMYFLWQIRRLGLPS